MQAQAFLERHAPRLVEIAKDLDPKLAEDSGISQFLERVYADFDTVVDKPGARASLPGEDVFWWCVTILEELDELPRPTAATNAEPSMLCSQPPSAFGTTLPSRSPARTRLNHWQPARPSPMSGVPGSGASSRAAVSPGASGADASPPGRPAAGTAFSADVSRAGGGATAGIPMPAAASAILRRSLGPPPK